MSTLPEAAAPVAANAGSVPSTVGALAGLSLCMLLPSLGTSIATVALPTFAEDFAASFNDVQWIVLAYLLANTAAMVGVGRLGDTLGRRRLLMAGLAVFTLASVLCGVASELWQLVAARAVQGIGAAALIAMTMALVGDTVPKRQTGRAMGLLGTTSAIGTALGPSLGGVLVHGFGWPALFFINVPLGALALFLAWRHLPPDHRTAAAPGRAASPSIRWATLRDPTLSAGLAMSAIVSAVMMATLVVGPFYLGRAFGLASAAIGLAMSAGPVVSALAGVPAGRAVDRHGAARMTIVGLVGMVCGCLALGLVPAAWGIAGYVLPLAVLTAHYALFQAANNTAVMKDVAPDRRGVASGLLNLSRNLGLILGASVMGSVFAFAGMGWTFVLAAGLLVAALAIAAVRVLGKEAR